MRTKFKQRKANKMKSAAFVSIFMAVMIFVGSIMTPASVNETSQDIETAVTEVENF